MSDHSPDLTKMIAEREFLEGWLQIAGTPIGQECCCRPERGECCGNAEPVYLPAEQVIEQMGTRHRELCAQMAATCKPDLPVAQSVDWEAVAADQAMTIALLRAEKTEHGTDPEALEAAYMLGRRDGMEAERRRSGAEIERLRGIRPALPPFPPDGDGLPRFGIRWSGPDAPLTVPMDDGYWVPWHLAKRAIDGLRAALTMMPSEPTDEDITWAKQAKEADDE